MHSEYNCSNEELIQKLIQAAQIESVMFLNDSPPNPTRRYEIKSEISYLRSVVTARFNKQQPPSSPVPGEKVKVWNQSASISDVPELPVNALYEVHRIWFSKEPCDSWRLELREIGTGRICVGPDGTVALYRLEDFDVVET